MHIIKHQYITVQIEIVAKQEVFIKYDVSYFI